MVNSDNKDVRGLRAFTLKALIPRLAWRGYKLFLAVLLPLH